MKWEQISKGGHMQGEDLLELFNKKYQRSNISFSSLVPEIILGNVLIGKVFCLALWKCYWLWLLAEYWLLQCGCHFGY